MKALAWFGVNDVRVIDADVPDIVDPGDVVLKVTGSTICGSDLHLFHGEIMALHVDTWYIGVLHLGKQPLHMPEQIRL